MSGPLCPMTPDGAHKKKVWADPVKSGKRRSGQVCVKCGAMWTWGEDGNLHPYSHDQVKVQPRAGAL
jgi:hypothetical protein